MKQPGAIIAGVLLTLALFSQTSFAQTTEFTYQGRLLSGGLPASGNHDFQFSLYDALTGGNQVGSTVTLTDVNVNNGVFSVRIDFGNQFPGANRFLEIGVKESGATTFATLSPRQAITSTPYSIKSLNADNATNAVNATNLGGVKSDQFVGTLDPRLSDARTPLPGSASYIQNTTTQQFSSSFNISGNGTAGGTLSGNVVRATTSFNIGGSPILMNPGVGNTLAGIHAGINTTGQNNSVFGFDAGGNNTTGNGNSFFGTDSGFENTTGGANSFLGVNAGFSNTTGGSNSFFGIGAGFSNTTGSGNSFFGASAGGNTSASGIENSFFGVSAGAANTSGFSNAFFGSNVGGANTTGHINAFFGREAGATNTTGSLNSFFGPSAGFGNDTGQDNTAVGALSAIGQGNLVFASAIGARAIVSANDTIVLGKVAGNYDGVSRPADTVKVPGSLIVSGDVTAAGALALAGPFTTTGDLTVSHSLSVGTSMSIGGNLTTLGSSSVKGDFAADGDVLAGRSLSVGGSANIGGSLTASGNLGIGNNSANFGLDVEKATGLTFAKFGSSFPLYAVTSFPSLGFNAYYNGGWKFGKGSTNAFGGIVSVSPADGTMSFFTTNSGAADASATITERLRITQSGNVGLGTTTPAAKLTVSGGGGFSASGAPRFDLVNTTNSPVGFSQYVTGSGIWQLTTTAGSLRVTADLNGSVGIGANPNPISRLYVNGSTFVDGQINMSSLGSGGNTALCWNGFSISTCSSSLRYKSNINSFGSGLNLIRRLHPVTFNWKSNDAPDFGLVAEDVAAVEPLLVTRNDKGEIEGVKYDRVGVVLVNAVQEQQLQIESQQKEITEQKEIIKRQQEELSALKKLVCSQNPQAEFCQRKN